MVAAKGDWRGETVTFDEKTGACIWQDGEQFCLDFNADTIDDLIDVLQQLKAAEPRVLSPDEELALQQEIVPLAGQDSDEHSQDS